MSSWRAERSTSPDTELCSPRRTEITAGSDDGDAATAYTWSPDTAMSEYSV